MENVREHWGSRIGFFLASIGSTVGLGLLWKFPYVIGENGGGLFLITYFMCILLVGVPLFIAEIVMGQRTQKAAIQSFDVMLRRSAGVQSYQGKNFWQIGGYLGVVASFLIMSFYSVIAGWGMSYVLTSLNGFYLNHSPKEIEQVFTHLSQSGGITLLWHCIFTLITMAIVMRGVREGIERWSKIMVRLLLIMLVGLFLYSTTLSGFPKAVHFIFYPSVNLFTVSSFLEALGLAFMTMSIGQGIMISFGSYLKPGENVFKMALAIAVSIMIVAILAALTIFPVVFTFGLSQSSGVGLVFETLPYLFAQLPGTTLISTTFFMLFVFTALTSAVPLVEVVTTNIMEKYGMTRKKAAMLTALATFSFGIPSALAYSKDLFPQWTIIFGSNFLNTVNEIVSVWIIPLAGLVTSIFIGWRIKKDVWIEGEQTTLGSVYAWNLWYFAIRWIAPITILLIIMEKMGLFFRL